MEETVVFEASNVKVTNTRFIIDGRTYAIDGVSAVERVEHKPPRIVSMILAIFGLATIAASVAAGLAIIGAACALWVIQKAEYSVRLSTASGTATALASKDRAYIERVVSALNQAIGKRDPAAPPRR